MAQLLPLLGLLLLLLNCSAEKEGIALNEDEMKEEDIYNATYSETLNEVQKKILKGYNRMNRPVRDPDTPTEVSIHLHVTHISFNSKEHTMTVHGHMFMTWFDEFLYWNPANFSGVKTTNLHRWQVWTPDIRVSNSINGVFSVHDISRNAHVSVIATESENAAGKNGARVETYPTFSMRVGCDMDFSDYPMDDHICAVNLFTPMKMNEVELKVYANLQPTIFLSWTNGTSKLHSGDFTIYRASNNISYFRFGDSDLTRPQLNDFTKSWSIFNIYIYYKRHNVNYFVTVVIPLATTTILSLCSLMIRDVQFATLMNTLTFMVHGLYIRDFIQFMPVSIYALPPAMMYHGFTFLLTIIVFCFNLFFWVMSSQTPAQNFLIDKYSRIYNVLPINPYPGFMNNFVKGLGEIRTRGWDRNVAVWRTELSVLLSIIYSVLFTKAFII